MKTKLLALLTALAMLFCLTACGGEAEPDITPDDIDIEQTETPEITETPVSEDGGDWAIYWYLCGSDLESNGGFATTDLGELTAVPLPEGVRVVIETGGANEWHNELVDASKLQRWVYDSEGFQLVDEQPSANMGEAQTLADFLAFAQGNYPAEHTMVVFWNHGGGSVSGAAFDELYDLDSLSLAEMQEAFASVWEPNAEDPALEIIGFDTCLMATVDTAAAMAPFARYLVASEETEPANGWYYTGWVGALAENPAMDAETLGRTICDAYYAGCETVGTQDNTTLSLTDLSAMPELLAAYEAFGQEALVAACADPSFFTTFGRAALQSENYGGNTREQGYTNMVDLGHLARLNSDYLTSAEDVLSALSSAVLYQVGGKYRTEATGLACYYSYNGDLDDLYGYAPVSAGSAFPYFFYYELLGSLDEGGMDYLAELDITELPTRMTLGEMGWDSAPLDVSDEGTAILTLGPEAENILTSIGFSLSCAIADGTYMRLGTDNDMTADWENGVFYDNFRGVWGSIDGVLVYMELAFAGDDYNLYSVPVLINGEPWNLQVVYDFVMEDWTILGARQGVSASGMADKELLQLSEGDELTALWYLAGEDGDFQPYEAGTVTVTADTAFAETQLPDGSYSMVFEMRDAAGGVVYSEPVTFDCEGGEIYTSVG